MTDQSQDISAGSHSSLNFIDGSDDISEQSSYSKNDDSGIVVQQNKTVHSWRPPTPPPAAQEQINGTTSKAWIIKRMLSNGNQTKRLQQYHSHDESNVNFLSPDTADIFDQEPINSLLLTEEGKYPSDNDTEASSIANNLLKGNTTRKSTLFQKRKQPNNANTAHNADQEDKHLSTKYQMMKSQHGTSYINASSFDEEQHDLSFFYNGMDDLKVSRYRHERNAPNWNRARNLQQESTTYFDHSLRRDFVEAHAFLNAVIKDKNAIHDDDDDDGSHDDDMNPDHQADDDSYMDFSTLFSFGCSPSSRQRHMENEKDARLPAIADIRKSSLSYFHKGRVQMRLPTDHIRLAMDEFLEPGILIVERPLSQLETNYKNQIQDRRKAMCDEIKNDAQMPLLEHSHQEDEMIICETMRVKSDPEVATMDRDTHDDHDDIEQQILEPLNYILTVDQSIYKRLLADISSSRMPCGLYYCCHDTVDHSKHVHIGVAISILSVVFTFIFVATCIWPLD